jgi:hypothetical protein
VNAEAENAEEADGAAFSATRVCCAFAIPVSNNKVAQIADFIPPPKNLEKLLRGLAASRLVPAGSVVHGLKVQSGQALVTPGIHEL